MAIQSPEESISLTTFYGLYITNYRSSWYIHLLWAASICQSAKYILELYIRIQFRTIQLLIFTEKFSPLPEFEPRTSPVPSWYATNWAILAWIWPNSKYCIYLSYEILMFYLLNSEHILSKVLPKNEAFLQKQFFFSFFSFFWMLVRLRRTSFLDTF